MATTSVNTQPFYAPVVEAAQKGWASCGKYSKNLCDNISRLAHRISAWIKLQFNNIVNYVKDNPEVSKKGLIGAAGALMIVLALKYAGVFDRSTKET